MLGTVDLVFKQDGREVYRLDDVNIFSDLTIPEVEGSVYTYGADGSEKEFSDSIEFRFEIGKTVLLNFLSFKWDEPDNYIELTEK